MLEDIAILTGGIVISEERGYKLENADLTYLGSAEKVVIDKEKCKEWLRLIPQYTKKYDENKKMFLDTPLHDWTSHGADMYRYASLVIDKMTNESAEDAMIAEVMNSMEDFNRFDPI